METQAQTARDRNDAGVCHYLAGRPAEAEAEYRAALALDPDDSAAHNNLGFLLAQAGRWSEALGHLHRAVDLTPGDATAQANLGQALAASGDIQDGLIHLARAVSLDPADRLAWDNLGRVRLLAGDPAGAAAAWARACALTPPDTEGSLRLRRRLATALAAGGKSEEAIALLDQALHAAADLPSPGIGDATGETAIFTLPPSPPTPLPAGAVGLWDAPGEQAEAWALLGTLLFLREDHGSARAALDRALGLVQDHRDALRHLGLVHLATGEPGAARKTYERLVAADPCNREARVDLAVLLLSAGHPEAALHHLTAPGLDPPGPEDRRYAFYHALALVQTGKRHAALPRLKALATGSDDYARRAEALLQSATSGDAE